MSMGIRIETTKEINDVGEIGYRVTAVKALRKGQLPALYLESKCPIVYFGRSILESLPRLNFYNLPIGAAHIDGITQDHWYSETIIEKVLIHIQAAGQHLADVKRKFAERRKAWQGKVVFVDGKIESAETVLSKKPSDAPMERIAELWGNGKLYYRDIKGHIRLLKPAE